MVLWPVMHVMARLGVYFLGQSTNSARQLPFKTTIQAARPFLSRRTCKIIVQGNEKFNKLKKAISQRPIHPIHLSRHIYYS